MKESQQLDDQNQPAVFLCATLWWPTSARLAMAFLNSGCRVSGICPSGHPLRVVDGVDSIYPYRASNSIGSLRAALRAAKPDLIVPCDDGAVWQLHALHAAEPEFRALIERSLGTGEAYATLDSRILTLQVASELGIRVPPSQAITSLSELSAPDLEWPAVLKIDGTWGGDGVVQVDSPSHAIEVLPTLFGARRTAIALKQFLVNRHPVALWLWRRRHGSVATLQKFIRGRQATTMFACWQGEVLATVVLGVCATLGPAGAATILQLERNDEIELASRRLARRLNLSGFHGLDFILEEGTEIPYLIEMNPRATQLGHLNMSAKGNLADALAAKLTNRTLSAAANRRRVQSDTIALFPHAWKTDPGNEALSTGFHDVPWDQPRLVEELLKKPWPERRLLNRIFNGLRILTAGNQKQWAPQSNEEHRSADQLKQSL